MMDTNNQNPDEGLLHAAADWWLRLRDPDGAPETVERWLAWVDADPGHLAAFERVNALGGQLGALDDTTRRQWVNEFAPPTVVARPRRWLPLAAAAATGALVLLGGYLGWSRFATNATSQVYASAVGQNRDIVLADGTRVTLGGASKLTARYSRGQREIELSAGEAYFQVVHNASRPFVVKAGQMTVRDVGTAFDVRRTGGCVNVAVTQGLVQVSAGGNQGSLQAGAGEQVFFTPDSGALSMSSVDTSQVGTWRDNRLAFVDEPLDVVVANINRYSALPLRIADPDLARLSFTGTVRTDAINDWLEALPQVLPLKVQVSANQVTLSDAHQHAAR